MVRWNGRLLWNMYIVVVHNYDGHGYGIRIHDSSLLKYYGLCSSTLLCGNGERSACEVHSICLGTRVKVMYVL